MSIDIDIRDAAPNAGALLILLAPSQSRVFSRDAPWGVRAAPVDADGLICLGSFAAKTVASEIESWLEDHEDRLEEIIDTPEDVEAVDSIRRDLKTYLSAVHAIYYDFATVCPIEAESCLDYSGSLDFLAKQHVSSHFEAVEMHLREADVRECLERRLRRWLSTAASTDPRRENVLRLLGCA